MAASKQTDKEADRASLFPINSRRDDRDDRPQIPPVECEEGEGESANIANKDTFYGIESLFLCENKTAFPYPIFVSSLQLSVSANWHLSFAMHFSSDGRTEALFVEHSGKWDNGWQGRKGIMGCSPFLVLI